MARTRPGIGGGRHHVRERGVRQWLADRSIAPHMRTRDSIHRKRSPFDGPERSLTSPKTTAISVPQASRSTMVVGFIGTVPTTTSGHAHAVARARKDRNAPVLPSGASSSTRTNQPATRKGLVNTPEFAHIRRRRTKWEALFAELKNQIGLHRLRLRRLRFVREQFFLAAAQNIKRLSVSSATGKTNIGDDLVTSTTKIPLPQRSCIEGTSSLRPSFNTHSP